MTIRDLVLTAAFVATAFGTTAAQAEFLRFDDSGAGKIRLTANGFLLNRLTVNGVVFNAPDWDDFQADFDKGATLNFSGSYGTVFNGAVTRSTTYLFVDSADPTTVIGEMLYTLTRINSANQQVVGTFWGIGSGRAFSALGSGTVVTLGNLPVVFNGPDARAANLAPSSNLQMLVAMTPAAVPEPATWGMMIAGFGLAGTTLRRERRPVLA